MEVIPPTQTREAPKQECGPLAKDAVQVVHVDKLARYYPNFGVELTSWLTDDLLPKAKSSQTEPITRTSGADVFEDGGGSGDRAPAPGRGTGPGTNRHRGTASEGTKGTNHLATRIAKIKALSNIIIRLQGGAREN